MFSQVPPQASQHRTLAVSLAAHALFFVWLLHPPEPRLLQPSSAGLGTKGRVVARIYFPTQTPDNSDTTSPDNARQVYRRQRLGHEKVIFKPAFPVKSAVPRALSPSQEDNSQTATLSNRGHGALAGLPYGSLPGSPIYSDEVRPALPVTTSDPDVYPWQRPTSEGKVIIEITIDERGEIVRKTVLQSLGSDLDNRCLAALEKWRFQPATRNGVPIPSKQDAIFPFKARG
ncbi:MAG TPA: TonB family protein [Candidatus Binatia bacterium]|nr:TonB family protein [Candidatus Binatia bacterium]